MASRDPASTASQENPRWAFERVKKLEPPPDPTGWATNPIDRFISAKLRDNGISPGHLADPRTLLRRASFDLTGLPRTTGTTS
jgi:hypothetical protein